MYMIRQPGIVLGLLLSLGQILTPAIASAEAFAMSSAMRNFCCTDWIDASATPTPAPNPGGGAFGLIGGVARQGALVSRTVGQDTSSGGAGPPLICRFRRIA